MRKTLDFTLGVKRVPMMGFYYKWGGLEKEQTVLSEQLNQAGSNFMALEQTC